MDVKRLQILRELADRGSVGATADALNVTASAVSQQLKVLQEETGVLLVEKSGRGVKLTEAGLAMAAAAADVAAAMERVQATVDSYRSGWQQQIRAAFFPSSAEMFLPGLLYRLRGLEGVHFAVSLEDPSVAGFVPLTADYDFVVAHSLQGADVFEQRGITVVELLDEPLDVGMPADHPLAAKDALEAEDVVDYPWIGVPRGFPFEQVLAQIEARTGRLARRILRFPDLRVMEAMVAAGHGLAMLPRYTSLKAQGRGFTMRPIRDVRAHRSIVALVRSDLAERTTIRTVLGLLREEARLVASQQSAVGQAEP
ncbi:LysR family transcriptional regulator [Arthrobacter mobilis]|uniref:LysR family transcriptional regulator n=1 Tax=Arthrobacter mobilis TaxID=2724944 RepID=A0A7X6HEC4_9MICC|nr:LysR family transcriptional regulator [Arthrobacter mobilis]NKX54648.1 LysR family transcriptional regulator [Arthrobacter mobilis]